MLQRQDLTLNFYKPIRTKTMRSEDNLTAIKISRRIVGENGRTSASYRNIRMTSGLVDLYKKRYGKNTTNNIKLIEKLIKDEFKIAFSFGGGEENIAILNPSANVPHFIFSQHENVFSFSNARLIDDIWRHFNISKKTTTIYLEFKYFTTLNNLHLYNINVLTERREPYFNDNTIIES